MDHVITLAGKERELRYEMPDRKRVERICDNKPIIDVLFGGTFEQQAAIIWAGLRHTERNDFTPALVEEWLEEHRKAGGEVEELLIVAGDAIGRSGVAGYYFTISERGDIRRLGKGERG